MFADRFDALMNVAAVSNSLLGRAISMDSSHIGRLRNGARPLPKKHEFLMPMCLYLAEHIKKDYQRIALQKLTGIGNAAMDSTESMAQYLENWLLEQAKDTSDMAERLISGFSRVTSRPGVLPAQQVNEEISQKIASHLYGNAGKRKAVEQFFMMILQEDKPQTLLLFSDESFEWLYEDAAFAARWGSLLTRVLMKGNRVRIIHVVSRDMNDMMEGIMKWLPIYMTGMIEPYYFPRLRDGIFQRTMFIAPQTAAIVSSCVMNASDGMLNIFLTDKAALDALTLEYERYLALCRPLMRIFAHQETEEMFKAMYSLAITDHDAYLYQSIPPLFALPEKLVKEIAEQSGNDILLTQWKKSLSVFRKNIKNQRLYVTLLKPEIALLTPELLQLPLSEILGMQNFVYSPEQYLLHIERMKKLEEQYENLTVTFKNELTPNLLLYVKEDTGVVIAKTDYPMTAFVISERNMTSAFWDYLLKDILS